MGKSIGSPKDLNSKRWQSLTEIGDEKTAGRTLELAGSSKRTITGEGVSFTAGAAGTIGVVSVGFAPVCNATASHIGSTFDTSFAWVTGTVLTAEVEYRKDLSDAAQHALMANGNFALDYDTGRIRYKKATTGISDTCNYSVRQKLADTELELHGDLYVDNVKTYATNIADPATQSYGLVDASGHLQVDVLTSSGQYAEDAAHTTGEIGNFILAVRNDTLTATLTSTDGDYSAIAVDSKGAQFSRITDGTNFMPTGDAVARSIHTAVGDGTTTATVETGTKKALNVNITDGTNDMPTMDAVGRAGFVKVTDGTAEGKIIANGADAISNTAINGLNTCNFLFGYNGTTWDRLNSTSGALDVHIASPVVLDVDLDGIYDVTTNPTPDTTGVTVAQNAAAPALTDMLVRLTGGINNADALVAANLHALDTRGLLYGYNGATWDRLRADATDGLLVNLGTNNDVAVTGTVAVTTVKPDGTNTMPSLDVNTRAGFMQVTDGTNEADVIATINSLKTDTSSIAGAVTAVGIGAVNTGTQRIVEAQGGAGYYSSEDASFEAGDSPATLDINTALSRNATMGYVANDGAGDFTITINSGAGAGSAITIKAGDVFDLRGLDVDTIVITHVADSAYRVFAK